MLAKASGALAAASVAYGALALARTRAFARRVPAAPRATPSISVLKPLHGDEPLLAAKLRSFCAQDYPDFEVIFGARDAADPALAVARAVAAEFPERRVQVAAGYDAPPYANPKARTLAGIVPLARGAILAVVDSDMRVDPGWLRALAAAFDDPRVGAATCLYRGVPADPGLPSQLGALFNHGQYAPSVLVAEALGPVRFTFGSTMAVRREVFGAIGGLDALGAHVADDARLGELVAEHGFRVALVPYVVENIVAEPTLGALVAHELRWARTHRVLRPAAYAGLALTYPLPLALLHLALARTPGAVALAGAALALRYALAASAQRAFGVREPLRAELVPLRDALGLAIWAAAFLSRDVAWRGEELRLAGDGRLLP